MLTGSRVDTWLTHFQVDSVFLGNWDTFSGAETDSEESLYRPGGYDESMSLGGRQTLGNATLARYWDDWVNSFYGWLRGRAGKARIYVARYPMTADFVQLGGPHGFQGTLKRVSPPDYDSNGGDAALIECECTLDRAW